MGHHPRPFVLYSRLTCWLLNIIHMVPCNDSIGGWFKGAGAGDGTPSPPFPVPIYGWALGRGYHPLPHRGEMGAGAREGWLCPVYEPTARTVRGTPETYSTPLLVGPEAQGIPRRSRYRGPCTLGDAPAVALLPTPPGTYLVGASKPEPEGEGLPPAPPAP